MVHIQRVLWAVYDEFQLTKLLDVDPRDLHGRCRRAVQAPLRNYMRSEGLGDDSHQCRHQLPTQASRFTTKN